MNTEILDQWAKVVQMNAKRQQEIYEDFLRRQAIQLTQPAQVIKMNQDKKRRA